MADHWLFFLDADGWLVGPESAPFPGEARILNTALAFGRSGQARNRNPLRGLRTDHVRRRRSHGVARPEGSEVPAQIILVHDRTCGSPMLRAT
jgi:hypothetical protein